MPNIEQMVANLKDTVTGIGNMVDVISIHGKGNGNIEVHVKDVEALTPIDGEIVYTPWQCNGYPEYTMEASVTVDGVKFYCLLKNNEVPDGAVREVN